MELGPFYPTLIAELKTGVFASRVLSSAEKNYAQIHKEGLAIVFALQKFSKYLYGNKFVIYTDHKPLKTLLDPKKGSSAIASARVHRWQLIISTYDCEIKYKKGSVNQNADAL